MPTTYAQAADEIRAQFHTNFLVPAETYLGYAPEIRWQMVEERDKPQVDYPSRFWLRHSIQTIDSRQTTFKDCNRRFTETGLVFVQIFGPMSDAQTGEKIRRLAEIVRNTMRGKVTANGVVFRNASINELSPENEWFRVNVVVGFEYDEIEEG